MPRCGPPGAVGVRASRWLIILVLGVFQSAAEEYLTRGWLLQAIRFASPWPGIIVQAVIWTALHGTGPGPGSVGLLVYGS